MKKIERIPKDVQLKVCLTSLVWLIVCTTFSVYAQYPITGLVTDKATGESLIGVNIIVKGEKIGTATDIDGNFSLNTPSPNSELVISYMGYITKYIKISGQKKLKIEMESDNKILGEVVVVGYGTQKKETVVGAISSIGNKDIVKIPVANVSNMLVGQIPGISAVQASGEPGKDAATIRIRGISTFNNSGQEPLIVIDGIQQTQEALNAMDPNEIENINVLKDASATAVYGVKGANGVIIVTTRRGKTGKIAINFSANFGMNELTSMIKSCNSYEWALFRNQAIQNDGDPSKNNLLFNEEDLWKFLNHQDYTDQEMAEMGLSQSQMDRIRDQGAIYYTDHDWYKETYGKKGLQQQYNLNISGGTEKVRYFSSVGYFSQSGNFNNQDHYGGKKNDINSYYNRYNIRTNIDADIFKNLTVSVNLSGEFTEDKGFLGENNSTSDYNRYKSIRQYTYPPFAGPSILNGKMINYTNRNPIKSRMAGGPNGWTPVADLFSRSLQTTNKNMLFTNISVEHKFDYLLPGLSLKGAFAYNDTYKTGNYRSTQVPFYTADRSETDPSEIIYTGGTIGPQSVTYTQGNCKARKYYYEVALNYIHSFGPHNVSGLILGNAQKYHDPSLLYKVPQGLMGLTSRVTYNFDERYLFEFNMAYNGSENFPPEKRFGFFPSVSAGWVISNEPYFPKTQYISWIKIRGSYGEVGNDNLGGSRFMYLPSTWMYTGSGALNGYNFGYTDGTSTAPSFEGVTENQIGNPLITWERARKFNIALETRFFNNRLSFIGDYFYEKRDQILWNYGTISNLVGAKMPAANIGKMSNKGYELQLEWRDMINSFSYYIKGAVSYARNRIDYMDEPMYNNPWMNTTGYMYGQYKGLKSNGFYNTEEEVNLHNYSVTDGNKVRLGDIKYLDIDGDGKIDQNDYVPIGYSPIPLYTFNLSAGIEYKGFSLSAIFVGSAKGSFMLSNYATTPFTKDWGSAWQWMYEGQWTPEKVAKGEKITFPRASLSQGTNQNYLPSDFWLRSTDFFRLKNLEIAYNFTQLGALKKIGIQGIRIYINGNNLLTWKSKDLPDGIDPEQSSTQYAQEGLLYPMTRVYNIGVKLQF